MSKSDPLTLECCFCHAKQEFSDQGQAIENWSVEENTKGEMFALCTKDARNQIALDTRMCLVMGKPIPEGGVADAREETKEEKVVTKGVKIRARFKLVSIDVEVAGMGIAGTAGELPELLKSLDILTIGNEYAVNLK